MHVENRESELMKQTRRAVYNAMTRSAEFAEKVAPYFKANNWTWGLGPNSSNVPTADDIEITLNTLCTDLLISARRDPYFNGDNCVSTGRLQVRVFVGSDHNSHCVFELVPAYMMTSSRQ